VEGVPFARDGAQVHQRFREPGGVAGDHDRQERDLPAARIDWQTIGRIIERVGDELIDGDRLGDLSEISIEARRRLAASLATSSTGS
jgi:hypothetical protein